jgi:hypothetical protein
MWQKGHKPNFQAATFTNSGTPQTLALTVLEPKVG